MQLVTSFIDSALHLLADLKVTDARSSTNIQQWEIEVKAEWSFVLVTCVTDLMVSYFKALCVYS